MVGLIQFWKCVSWNLQNNSIQHTQKVLVVIKQMEKKAENKA